MHIGDFRIKTSTNVKVTPEKKGKKRKVKCDQASKKSLHRNRNKDESSNAETIGGETRVKFIDVRKGFVLETRFSADNIPKEGIKTSIDIKTTCLQWYLLQRSEANML